MTAVLYLADDKKERECKRMNVFRDRNNPLEVLNDIEVIVRYRLPRNVLISLVELVREDVERPMKRSHSLSALTQGNNSCTSSPIIFTYLIKARITYYINSSTYTLRKPMLWNVQYDKKKINKFLKRKGMNKTIRNLTQQQSVTLTISLYEVIMRSIGLTQSLFTFCNITNFTGQCHAILNLYNCVLYVFCVAQYHCNTRTKNV